MADRKLSMTSLSAAFIKAPTSTASSVRFFDSSAAGPLEKPIAPKVFWISEDQSFISVSDRPMVRENSLAHAFVSLDISPKTMLNFACVSSASDAKPASPTPAAVRAAAQAMVVFWTLPSLRSIFSALLAMLSIVLPKDAVTPWACLIGLVYPWVFATKLATIVPTLATISPPLQ